MSSFPNQVSEQLTAIKSPWCLGHRTKVESCLSHLQRLSHPRTSSLTAKFRAPSLNRSRGLLVKWREVRNLGNGFIGAILKQRCLEGKQGK